ncbi:MAG: CCDC90 family protein [Candidatus Accumulibacter sp.]|jgi:predicted RNase H-like nuclease (RuvC/YqgF family)|nr:CCDC90 family protein [Accumulibacter sp.]
MGIIPFDTHAIVKTLQTKGFQVEQAEGITDALKDALTIAEIATKHDIRESRGETQRDIEELRGEINGFRETMQRDFKEFREATQHDINGLREEMQHGDSELRTMIESKINELRLEFRADIAPLKWGMGFCAAGTLSIILKIFF